MDNFKPTVAEFAALPDERACLVGRKLDGRKFAFGSPEHIASDPPLEQCEFGRDGCTCVMLYHHERDSTP